MLLHGLASTLGLYWVPFGFVRFEHLVDEVSQAVVLFDLLLPRLAHFREACAVSKN